MTTAFMSEYSVEMTNNSAVMVAMLEMSLLGDGFFTPRPSHSSVPRLKTCLNSVRGTLGPETCDLYKSSFWQTARETPPQP